MLGQSSGRTVPSLHHASYIRSKLAERLHFIALADPSLNGRSQVNLPFDYTEFATISEMVGYLSRVHADAYVLDLCDNEVNVPALMRVLPADSARVLFYRDSRIRHMASLMAKKHYHIGETIRSLLYELAVTAASIDGIVVVSSQDARYMGTLFPWCRRRTVVIPNGVDLDSFRAMPQRNDQCQALFVGPLHYQPNLESAQFIVKHIAPHFMKSDLKFRIVGDYAESHLAQIGDLPSNVCLAGYVDDLPPEYGASRAFVAPIFVGSGIKNKVLEAMASGALVIGSPEAFNEIPVQDGVSAILCRRPDDYIRAVDLLLHDPRRCEIIGARGRQIAAEAFDWNLVSGRLYDLLMSSLQRRRRSH
jgi:glycosyltransferase involved in cell wall biosynthesis